MQKRLFLVFATLCLLWNTVAAQKMISAQFLGSRTRAQIASQFKYPLVQYDVRFYRVIYTTKNTAGQPDTVSGLVVVPQDTTRIFPRLVYQHGTSVTKTDVPSFNVLGGGDGATGLLFGGMGFLTIMPDYLGLGVAKGFHPYVHAASEAWVAADMLRALPDFIAYYQTHQGTKLHTNDQLFVTGYSQGGHASMAFHRDVEQLWQNEFKITAASYMSGPYSIGEVMRNTVLSDEIYLYPAYIPHTLISYQHVYGNLYGSLQQIFREPYATAIAQHYSGSFNLILLNTQLVNLLVQNEGSCRPMRMLQPALVQELKADDWHPINVALRDNNVYQWAPKAPARIFFCTADDQVPYQNSIVARDTMIARGAINVQTVDVNPNADHSACASPAIVNTLLFFLGYRDVGYVSSTTEAVTTQLLSLWPNPTSGIAWLTDLPGEGHLQVLDINGRLRQNVFSVTGSRYLLDLSSLEDGLYIVRFFADGRIWQNKVVLRR
ncbi:MAG: T9SS type A sorting domain-containing protein [Saprospiraceae bacterium]|nr:T9SS type A sorting domain-containing protein [Saprospiraceae bacterium]MDW8483132.1 T9SS type A sorting domain-containing protein [Saprospiraceae bacterium]